MIRINRPYTEDFHTGVHYIEQIVGETVGHYTHVQKWLKAWPAYVMDDNTCIFIAEYFKIL